MSPRSSRMPTSTAALACVLGAGDGSLPLALAEQSELLVYVRDPDAAKVADLKKEGPTKPVQFFNPTPRR